MILYADAKNLEEVERDLEMSVCQLITPLTGRRNFRPTSPFAIDNGCFSVFRKSRYFAILRRELQNAKFCKFVCLPDVVGSARRTLELFDFYQYDALICKFPKALVAQNGQEDLPIAWDLIDAIFIGGDDRFKCSDASKSIIQCAQRMGKWVHAGRVNTAKRWEWFEDLGVDSCDGSGISQYSEMRWAITRYRNHPNLF